MSKNLLHPPPLWVGTKKCTKVFYRLTLLLQQLLKSNSKVGATHRGHWGARAANNHPYPSSWAMNKSQKQKQWRDGCPPWRLTREKVVREQKDLARLVELLWDKNSSAAIQSLHKKSFLRLSLPELFYIYKQTFSYDCNANFAYKRFK